jgi:hypothetical protein
MLPDKWQAGLVSDLQSLLEPDERVRALVVFGSWASPDQRDQLSDVDVLLVVADGARSAFFPSNTWLGSIGGIFATERSERALHGVHRVCFNDGRRLDVVVVEEHVVADISSWIDHPLRTPLFARRRRTPRCSS